MSSFVTGGRAIGPGEDHPIRVGYADVAAACIYEGDVLLGHLSWG